LWLVWLESAKLRKKSEITLHKISFNTWVDGRDSQFRIILAQTAIEGGESGRAKL